MMTLYGTNVAIVPFDPTAVERVTEAGIIIPQIHKEKAKQGIVKYCGPKCEVVQVLDHVIFGAYDGKVFRVGEENLVLLDEEFIVAVVGRPEELIIPGLYIKSAKSGEHFSAPYETIATLVKEEMEKGYDLQYPDPLVEGRFNKE